ncbi:MAG: hypothetical protein COC19_04825 [SAR86 cluster bacterium]|uniref:Uncharacterized protein n=1 Tax=SAR86 cluster bacterium TaxID=2030880 RepID=A0A2A4MN85_9GAMM|nr:MAG: hypothetical protein COC19_04825 [SAR86 cluster bacterium]
MNFKPVVLIYNPDHAVVDDCGQLLGATDKYTTINTYNETNAIEALSQYNRGFGMLTNKLACIVTGWNSYKTRRDQLLFQIRAQEARSPLRKPTPVIIITEDHLQELKEIALDPTDGNVAAYLHVDDFKTSIVECLDKIIFQGKAQELNAIAFAQVQREEA